jgi:hypothetical protein
VGIEPGDELLHLERILLSDDEPMGLESTFPPAARFPRLRSDFDPRTSLYAYLRSAGVEFRSAVEHIETVLASPRGAALLGTNPRCRCCCSTGSPRTRADAPSSGSARCSAETVSASSPNSALSGGFPAGDRRQLLGLGPIDPHTAVVLLGTGICSMTGRESVDPPGSGRPAPTRSVVILRIPASAACGPIARARYAGSGAPRSVSATDRERVAAGLRAAGDRLTPWTSCPRRCLASRHGCRSRSRGGDVERLRVGSKVFSAQRETSVHSSLEVPSR